LHGPCFLAVSPSVVPPASNNQPRYTAIFGGFASNVHGLVSSSLLRIVLRRQHVSSNNESVDGASNGHAPNSASACFEWISTLLRPVSIVEFLLCANPCETKNLWRDRAHVEYSADQHATCVYFLGPPSHETQIITSRPFSIVISFLVPFGLPSSFWRVHDIEIFDALSVLSVRRTVNFRFWFHCSTRVFYHSEPAAPKEKLHQLRLSRVQWLRRHLPVFLPGLIEIQ